MNNINKNLLKKSGVYIITNLINGHRYVGSSINLGIRLRTHVWVLRKGKHFNNHLQNAWNKYGESAFEWGILKICNKDDRKKYEQKYILELNPEYNIVPVVDFSEQSKETSQKISIAMKEWHSKNESPLKKYKQPVFIYDIKNWTFVKEVKDLSHAANLLYSNKGSLKASQLNCGIILNKYVVCNSKFSSVLELQNFIYKNSVKYLTNDGKLLYLIVEKKDRSELIYFRSIPQAIKYIGSSSSSTIKKHLYKYPKYYNIPNSEYIIYTSDSYISLESRLKEESLRLLLGNIGESLEQITPR